MKISKTNLLIVLAIAQFMAIGCSSNSTTKVAEPEKKVVPEKDTIKPLVGNNNVMDEDSLPPFKEVNSLVKLIKQSYNTNDIDKLDSICCHSDGELSESLDGTTMELFFGNLSVFSNYFIAHPKCCFKVRLIEGIGSDYFVYEKSERRAKLKKQTDETIETAKKEKLSANQISEIERIFKKVNPDILD